MKWRVAAIVGLILASFGGLAEQTAYVTDSLRLRVYAEPSDTSEVLESIESGDSIEVLESQGAFSQVRTYAGSTGWVKSAFLVEEPPAKLLYYSVSEQNKQLEQQIQALQNNTLMTSNTDSKQTAELEKDLQEQLQANRQLQEQLALLKQEGQQQDSLETRVELIDSSTIGKIVNILLNHKLVLAGLAVALLLFGILVGIKLSSRRMRKRLHGFSLD